LSTDAVVHGKTYEEIAISQFENKTGLKVKSCGLFINENFPFLAATPDGIVGKDEIIEVKCPFVGRDCEIKPGKNFSFLHYTADQKVSLKSNHNYMYQVQGQLGISKKKFCYFVVYTFKDLFVEKVAFDEFFFTNEILPKTHNFYENFYRPHIASKL